VQAGNEKAPFQNTKIVDASSMLEVGSIADKL
jgi:hypothetical protein